MDSKAFSLFLNLTVFESTKLGVITRGEYMKITVAGVGYVGLSLAVLLAQNHEVTAITTTKAKAEKLNKFISPIQDDEIERFFRETRECERTLNLHTTTDKATA